MSAFPRVVRPANGPDVEHATPGSVIPFHPICGRASIPALLFMAVLMCSYSGASAQYFASRVTDAFPQNLINVNGTLFFSGSNGGGRELWKSDGTAQGTVLVKDINPGPNGSFPVGFAAVDGAVFFSADDGTGVRGLWKSDGTADGTVLVKAIPPVIGSLTGVGGTLFFVADSSTQLWKSDGTTAGTVLVKDIAGGSSPHYLTAVDNELFLVADDGISGRELWKSDGTTAGTVLVKDIMPGGSGSSPEWLTVLGDELFFAADDGSVGVEFWRSDGTEAGTVLVKDINPGLDASLPGSFAVLNGALFFDVVAGSDTGLWKSDGTQGGTIPLKTISAGEMIAVDGTLFFRAQELDTGLELWKSDGTAEGTVLVKDINEGALSSDPTYLTAVGRTLFFTAYTRVAGIELWRSDGTMKGTALVEDIRPGPFDSYPDYLTAVGDTLYFDIPDEVGSFQLWHAVPAPALSVTTPDLVFQGTVTVGDTSSARLEIGNAGLRALTIQNVQVPSGIVRYEGLVPFDVAPGALDTLTFFLEPRTVPSIPLSLVLATNDPLDSLTSIPVKSDIRALEIETTRMIPTVDKVPLGENVTVLVLPAPGVRIEQGQLFHRPVGAGTFASIPLLKKSATDFQATIPGELVTELGLEYYVSVENSGIVTTDPPNAPGSGVFVQGVQAPTTFAAVPQPTAGTDFLEGREIRVLVEIREGSQFVSGAVHYRRGGEASYTPVELTATGPLLAGTIPSDHVDARGLDYWVEVQTATTHMTDPPLDPSSKPRQLQVTVPSLIEAQSHAGETYRMVSFPVSFDESFTGTIEDLLIDEKGFGEYNAERWRSWVWVTEKNEYGELDDKTMAELFRPQPGRAFWLVSRESHRVDTGPVVSKSTATNAPHEITLKVGWTMIGDPFAFPVAWSGVLSDGIPAGDDTLLSGPFGYGGGSYRKKDRLEPFSGYWIRSDHPQDITLRVPPVEAPTASALVTANRNAGDWNIRISARSGEAGDDVDMGVASDARDGRDRMDEMEPPMSPGRSVSVYAIDDAPRSLDRRDAATWRRDGGVTWAVDVAKNFSTERAGDDVVLTFEMAGIPVDQRVVMLDRMLGREIDLRRTPEYSLVLGEHSVMQNENDARFVLVVGSDAYLAAKRDLLPRVPTQTVLRQNTPNPFNPVTVIRYDLAAPANVALRIYDLHGALVKTLETARKPAGRYEVGWNGENERGERVASGVYFYDFRAGAFRQTKKMVLLK